MALEMHVFFRGALPTKAALARAMRELGFPLSIKPATGSLERQSGFMPMLLRGEEAGAEFDVFDGRAAVEELAPAGVDAAFDRSANFRWSGDEREMLAALCASAALAKLTNGVVFDETEGRLLSVDEAIALARRNCEGLRPDDVERPGTRPADIRRYLQPLLKQRSDLILRGRLLLIRPVRHILRGAFLDRTSDKYQFRIWRYVKPLYDEPQGLAYGSSISPSKVWEPHFEHELLDSLAHDIFDHVGRLTTLADVAEELAGTDRFHSERVVALVLAGERERAAAYVEEMERKFACKASWGLWADEQRRFLARDISSLCEEYHAKEADTARALNLGDAWTPSPFPVELRPGERPSLSSEAAFEATPWMETPAWLVQSAPKRPGEVRFARKWIIRDGRSLLLAPLSKDEAEQMHRDRQDYVLVTRSGDGSLVVVRHSTGYSPHDPERLRNPHHVPYLSMYIDIANWSCTVRAWFMEADERGYLELRSIETYANKPRKSLWFCSLSTREKVKRVFDHQKENRDSISSTLSEDERNSLRISIPEFGSFDELLQSIKALLRSDGFLDENSKIPALLKS